MANIKNPSDHVASSPVMENHDGATLALTKAEEDNSGASPLTSSSLSTGNGSGTQPSGDDDQFTPKNKIFVGGLSSFTTPEKVRDYFSQFGAVTDVHLLKYWNTETLRGYGFVTFLDSGTASQVLAVPLHILDGKRIITNQTKPRKVMPRTKSVKVFVGGLTQGASSTDVEVYFSQFGLVEEVFLSMDHLTNRHRGFGFVTFDDPDVAARVCSIRYHIIKGKRAECKKSRPQDSLESLHAQLQRRLLGPRLLNQGLGLLGNPFVDEAATNYSNFVNSNWTRLSPTSSRYSPYHLPGMVPGFPTSGMLPIGPYGYNLPGSIHASGQQGIGAAASSSPTVPSLPSGPHGYNLPTIDVSGQHGAATSPTLPGFATNSGPYGYNLPTSADVSGLQGMSAGASSTMSSLTSGSGPSGYNNLPTSIDASGLQPLDWTRFYSGFNNPPNSVSNNN